MIVAVAIGVVAAEEEGEVKKEEEEVAEEVEEIDKPVGRREVE